MTVTYTSAAERDRRRTRRHAVELSWSDMALLAMSCVAALVIGLAYVGHLRAFDLLERERSRAGVPIVNLNTVTSPADLEPLTGLVAANVADRTAAARELYKFLSAGGDNRRTLPNVGAILRARRADARPLFTAMDLASMKPFATVRTRREFQRQVLIFSALYILA